MLFKEKDKFSGDHFIIILVARWNVYLFRTLDWYQF